MIQYPAKFDMVLAPLVKIEKNFVGYIFILYCKENLTDTKSIMNGYIASLEELLPISSYYEVRLLPSNTSEIKVIFTLPKAIYKTKDKGTIYNSKNLSAFHTLVMDGWYNTIVKLERNFIPRSVVCKKDHHFIPKLAPFKGDLELLNKTKTMLTKKFVQFGVKQTDTTYLRNVTDSYFESYTKFKRFDTFVFMLKMPMLNIHDNFVLQSVEHGIKERIPAIMYIGNSLNKVKGNYELYLHIPSSIVEGKWDEPFSFKMVDYTSLTGLIKNQWIKVLSENGILEEGDEGESLIGKNPVVFNKIDFKTTRMNDFIDKMESNKRFISKTFVKTN